MYPKQFLHILKERDDSLLCATLKRLGREFAPPVLLCNNDHRWLVRAEATRAGVNPSRFLLEPVPRNTSPAICAGALAIAETDPDAIMIVMPSDHVVANDAGFVDAIRTATRVAGEGRLVLFGVKVTEPMTSYGYINRGEALAGFEDTAYAIDSFVEKPDVERAAAYMASGKHYWNGGIFVMHVGTLISEMERLSPETLHACREALRAAEQDMGFTRLEAEAFSRCPNISIDYEVMERTDKAAMVPLDVGWSDIGSWSALWSVSKHDEAGNSVKGDAILVDTRDCLVHGDAGLLATVGISNMIVVRTPDAVLVADRHRAQDVGRIVDRLKASGRNEHIQHTRNHRPWGYFESLSIGPRFQVKLLHVNPNSRLSMQMHHHRSEHWVVVHGTAKVTIDGTERLVGENQSVYISATQWHRLENPGKVPLDIIEVQLGSYLGEDDIIRCQDDYRRSPDESK
jgi:mannose-1-phosphate guanylyltransferase/mannose-6-phosphate isomerase